MSLKLSVEVIRRKSLEFIEKAQHEIDSFSSPRWKIAQTLLNAASRYSRLSQKAEDEGVRRTLYETAEIFVEMAQKLEFHADKSTIGRWNSGQRMDPQYDIPITSELCKPEERVRVGDDEQQDLTSHRLWNGVEVEPIQIQWAFPDRKYPPQEFQIHLALELRDSIRLFVVDYNSARKLAIELAKIYAQRLLQYELWARVRNYLTRITLRRFASEVKGIENCKLWKLRDEARFMPPPRGEDQKEWNRYLRATVDMKEDGIDALDAEREGFITHMRMHLGIAAEAADSLYDGRLDENSDLCDLLDILSPQDAINLHWRNLREPEEEIWQPSKKITPNLVFHTVEEETRDLHSEVPIQSMRLAPEAIRAWMGDLRL